MAAKKAADMAGVPTLPATPNPVSKPAEALKWGKKIGFPLIKGCFRWRWSWYASGFKTRKTLKPMLEEAQGEAERAFGNSSGFLERYVGRAKHLEVQVLGDRHGNGYIYERDCSV